MRNLIIALIVLPIAVYGQNYKLSEKVDLEVIGTSTLHGWEMVSENGEGNATIVLNGSELVSIDKLDFTAKTKTLKSGKGAMDKICYEAMKADKFADIKYTLKKVNSITKSGTGYTVNTTGDLTIAGKTNSANMVVKATVSQGKVKFVGEYDLKMTSFNIDPPTAMFGTIKTGDDIKVKFTVDYNEGGTL